MLRFFEHSPSRTVEGDAQSSTKVTGGWPEDSVGLLELERAAMALDHMVDDGQSQAAVTLFATGLIESLKGLKGPVPLIGRHALALIPDLNPKLHPVLPQANNDGWRAVGESVVDQV